MGVNMKVKFWGVRGSIPVPSPKTSKYGGNTSCVELNCDGKIIILDSGTGMRELCHDIISRNSVKKDGMYNLYMFFSHVHFGIISRTSLFFDQHLFLNLR